MKKELLETCRQRPKINRADWKVTFFLGMECEAFFSWKLEESPICLGEKRKFEQDQEQRS